jgi:hypothetical protein
MWFVALSVLNAVAIWDLEKVHQEIDDLRNEMYERLP